MQWHEKSIVTFFNYDMKNIKLGKKIQLCIVKDDKIVAEFILPPRMFPEKALKIVLFVKIEAMTNPVTKCFFLL